MTIFSLHNVTISARMKRCWRFLKTENVARTSFFNKRKYFFFFKREINPIEGHSNWRATNMPAEPSYGNVA